MSSAEAVGPSGGGKFVSHGQPQEEQVSGLMASVKTKAEAVLPERAMTALSNAGARIERIGGLAGVLSFAIPEQSWQVFSNLDDWL